MHSGHGRAVSALFLLLLSLAGAAARAQNSSPQSGNLLIADFDGGKIETVLGLALAPICDDQLGGTSDARMTLVHPGAQGSQGALRISFLLGEGFAYPFSGAWAFLGTEGLPMDLSAYKGLRFYARSQGTGAFRAGVRQNSAPPGNYMAPFEVKPEWTLVELPFDKLVPSPPTGKPSAPATTSISSVGFSVSGRPPAKLDLEIDQVELYK
ncbi:MAG: CIA30 family protein [Thermoanaerobaculia bacterium]